MQRGWMRVPASYGRRPRRRWQGKAN